MKGEASILLVALALAVAGGCGGRPDGAPAASPAATEMIGVFVTIPPLAGLVERVGGEHVTAHVLVPPGRCPHTFEPTPRQIVELGRSRLYCTIGLPLEERIRGKVEGAGRGLRVVDISVGIKRRRMAVNHDHEPAAGSAGHEKASGHDEGADPHIWLSPPLIKILARNLAGALSDADPAHAQDYESNLAALLSDIDEVHARLTAALSPYRGRSFYVFHPAFGYFGDAYGLRQEAVEVEGKSPSARDLTRLVNRARAEKVRVVFVQPQFDPRSARTVAASIGGAVVPLDPLARDVLKNLQAMAGQVERALKPQPRVRGG